MTKDRNIKIQNMQAQNIGGEENNVKVCLQRKFELIHEKSKEKWRRKVTIYKPGSKFRFHDYDFWFYTLR